MAGSAGCSGGKSLLTLEKIEKPHMSLGGIRKYDFGFLLGFLVFDLPECLVPGFGSEGFTGFFLPEAFLSEFLLLDGLGFNRCGKGGPGVGLLFSIYPEQD
jgi:hypothetical protein